MSQTHPFAKRFDRARAFIQKARELPAPPETGWSDFSYVAKVKDMMRQARDQVKLIQHSPSMTPKLKEELAQIYQEMKDTEKELLKR